METVTKVWNCIMSWWSVITSNTVDLKSWWASLNLSQAFSGFLPEIMLWGICWYFFVLILRELGKKNFIVTLVTEGAAKNILVNNGFFRSVFVYKRHFMQKPIRFWRHQYYRYQVDPDGNKVPWDPTAERVTPKLPRTKETTVEDADKKEKNLNMPPVKLEPWEVVDIELIYDGKEEAKKEKSILKRLRIKLINSELMFKRFLVMRVILSTAFLKISGLYGIKIVGLPGVFQVQWYMLRWSSLRQFEDAETQKTDGGIIYKSREKRIDYILLQPDIYYARIEDAEDENMVPLDLDVTLFIKNTNPYLFLFGPQDTFEYIWGTYLPYVRVFSANEGWHNLNKERDKKSKSLTYQLSDIRDEIHKVSGSSIQGFKFLRISPAGELKAKYEEASTAKYFAEQKGEAQVMSANFEATAIDTVYGTIQKYGKDGTELRRLQTIEKTAGSVGSIAWNIAESLGMSKLLGKPKTANDNGDSQKAA